MNLRKLFKSEAASGYLLLSPTALYSFIVMAAPLIAVVLFSFETAGYLKIIWTPTLDNYRTLAEQPIYATLMVRSLIVAAAATAATVFGALPIAYFISFYVSPEKKSLWLFLITIPFWTSYLIRVFLWKVILGYNGVINSAFLSLGIIHEPMTFLLYNMNSVIITLGARLCALRDPADLRQPGKDRPLIAGGRPGPWRKPLHDFHPRHPAPGHAGDRGGGSDRIHPDGGRLCDADAGRWQQRADDREPDPEQLFQTRELPARLGHLGGGDGDRLGHLPDLPLVHPALSAGLEMKGRGFLIYAICYLVFLYAPIVLLPIFAFNDSTIMSFPLSGFTTKWFVQMWHNQSLGAAVQNSLIVASVTAIFATTLGVFAARASTRYRFPGKAGIMGAIMLPLVLPDIIIAVSLLVTFLQLGFSLTLKTIILGHTLIATPFTIAILNSAFQSLDRSLEEAAYDLGETKASTFRLIILPLVMPGIISSLLIAFSISLDEYIIASFLGGTNATLPLYIFSLFRFANQVPTVMALGTILVVASIILLTIAEYFRRRGIARAGGKDTGGFL